MNGRSPLRALVVDDERLARKRLCQMLAGHPEIAVAGEADGVESALAFVEREPVDVIFLDIQMPPLSGFDLLPKLQPLPRIVFVTAYDNFAVRAFEAEALDYLLKPVHPDRLTATVRRLLVTSPPTPAPAADEGGRLLLQDLVTLRDKGVLRVVPVRRIAAIEAEGAYSRVRIAGQESMLILRPIFEWESRLPSPPFARVDRSLLINLDRVRSVDVVSRDETHVGLEEVQGKLVLGRAASLRLRRLL